MNDGLKDAVRNLQTLAREDGASISVVTPDGITHDLAGEIPKKLLPQSTIDELMLARRIAKDYAQGYTDAVKAQAEKFDIKASALKRYIAALCDDKMEELDAEASDLARLIEGAG